MFSSVIILRSESTQSQIRTGSLNLAWICPLKGIFHSLSTRHEHSDTREMKCLLYRPLIHEATHISISSLQSSRLLWLFIWWETNQGFTIVRNKNHFHIEGYRKAKYGEKNIYVLAPFACSTMSHLKRQKGFHQSCAFWGRSQPSYGFCRASHLP